MKSKKISKITKALATVLAFSLSTNVGAWWFSDKPLTPAELSKPYTKEEMAALPKHKRQEINNFLSEYNEYILRMKVETGEYNVTKDTVRATMLAADKTGEKLTSGARALLYFVAGTIAMRNIGNIISLLKSGYDSVKHTVKDFFFKRNCKGIDIKVYEQVLAKIEKRLHAELVGQDEAIDKMITIMRGYFESVIEAKILGKKFEGGLLLYLTGMPATGKSTAMKIIEEEMGLTSYVGRMSDVVEDKGNKAGTVATRLTKPTIEDTRSVKVTVDSPLTRQIKTGLPTLYCLDEVDKMRSLDSVLQKRNMRNEEGKIIGSSIDEMLRNFGDTGQINGIDASGSILIATSNETPEQLAELESSLYNRYKGCHIHFKDFTKQDYVEIINRKIKNIKEYYKKAYDMEFVLDKSLLDHYSEKFVNERSGGRGTDVLMNKFRATLKNYINSNKNVKNKVISLNYDNQTNKIFVKNVK